MIDHIGIPQTEEEILALKEYLHEQQPEDIAEYIDRLDSREEKLTLLRYFDPEDVAIVFFELEDADLMQDLLNSLPEEEALAIAEVIPTDDAVDLLADLEDEEQDQILEYFDDEVADDIRRIMGYDEETAGGLMTTEFVVIPEYVHAEKAIDIIRTFSYDAETIYYIYVIDAWNHLVGIMSLRELIVADPQTKVSDIMNRNVVAVNVHDDQEEVADMIAKYNFLAVPVTDDDGHMAGIITVDDILDVIHEEATEDMYRMAGISESHDEEDATIFQSYTARMPWLLITILGGIGAGTVLSHFTDQLSAVIALTIFIPMIIGIAGNVGTQSATVTVRSIAMGITDDRSALLTILREALIGLGLGITLGCIVGAVATFWQGSPKLGLVVGLAIFINNFTAALMGTVVPLALKKMGIDPAVSSAPFITTAVDVLGLITYALVATLVFNL